MQNHIFRRSHQRLGDANYIGDGFGEIRSRYTRRYKKRNLALVSSVVFTLQSSVGYQIVSQKPYRHIAGDTGISISRIMKAICRYLIFIHGSQLNPPPPLFFLGAPVAPHSPRGQEPKLIKSTHIGIVSRILWYNVYR